MAIFAPTLAAADNRLVVHIECTAPDKPPSFGSGVLISAEGHVLTAKHVVRDGYTCTGGIGSIKAQKAALEPISQHLKFDGMVLKLDAQTPSHATYCELSEEMQGRDIRVVAFHPGSVKGPSEVEGVVSTHELNEKGMFEVSVVSIGGKSGGPAFLYGSTSLIGIVSGGSFNAVSEKIDMLTPVDRLAGIAPLKKAESCAPRIDGYTVEDHQRILKEREARIRADLGRASVAEKKLLFAQLDAVVRDLTDLQTSYEAREEELRKLRLQLSELNDGQVPSERLEAAQDALYGGDTELARQIFEEITEADAAAVKRVATSEYGLGSIAADEVKWTEAYVHYQKAARLNPNFTHVKAAWEYAYELGKYDDALRYSRDLLSLTKVRFGANSVEYASAITRLGIIYYNLTIYDEAEPRFREAMEIFKKNYGEGHPQYSSILHNLAAIIDARGDFEQAEMLFREAVRIAETTSRKTKSYAISLNRLGEVLVDRGQYDEAEHFFRNALEVSEEILVDGDPDLAIHLNSLGYLLLITHRLTEAEPLLRRALEVSEDVLGKDHAYLATYNGNLAALLERTDRFVEAEERFRESIRINEQTLGKKSDFYAFSLNDLALLLAKDGRHDEAEPLLQEAVGVLVARLGEQHPYTMSVQRNLENFLEQKAAASE